MPTHFRRRTLSSILLHCLLLATISSSRSAHAQERFRPPLSVPT